MLCSYAAKGECVEGAKNSGGKALAFQNFESLQLLSTVWASKPFCRSFYEQSEESAVRLLSASPWCWKNHVDAMMAVN